MTRSICRVVAAPFAIVIPLALAASVAAQEPPAIARFVPPAPDARHVFVLDSAHILSAAVVASLQDSARALQTETGADVAWITLPTLGRRSIEEAGVYVGRTWKIGSAGAPGDPLRNRGLVILFVPDKRTTAGSNIRVEVGNGLEGTITDSRSRAIITAMRADLKAKRYDAAYLAGWNAAAGLVREDATAQHAPAADARRTAGHRVAAATALHPAGGLGLIAALVVFVLLLAIATLFAIAVWRGRGGPPPGYTPPLGDDDDPSRRQRGGWAAGFFSDGDGGSSGSSGSDGGDFGGGGGFSGGGSSDSI